MTPDQVPDALVEKAARARWEKLSSVFTGYNGEVARSWDELIELFPTEVERRRDNERAVLAVILPEVSGEWLQ